MTDVHRVALVTACLLLTLGACALTSAVNRPPRGGGEADALVVPIAGVAIADLADSWGAPRGGGRRHEGVDIMVEEGTPVRAAASGTILKLHRSDRGGLTVYQSDASGWIIFCYAHLSEYADGLEEGQAVEQGEVIAKVGQSGNATTPHLHFEVLRARERRQWWGGEAMNPYRALVMGRIDPAASGDSGR